MLREFNRIAREMLFLHGHLTRPRDWAESAPADATPLARRGRAFEQETQSCLPHRRCRLWCRRTTAGGRSNPLRSRR